MLKSFLLYLKWHCFIAPSDFLREWRYFISLIAHYFSVPLLIRTLFEPWRRYIEEYPRGFDVQKYAMICLRNFISRVIGVITRIIVIFLGWFFIIFSFLGGLILFFIWIFLPALVLFGLIAGFVLIVVSL